MATVWGIPNNRWGNRDSGCRDPDPSSGSLGLRAQCSGEGSVGHRQQVTDMATVTTQRQLHISSPSLLLPASLSLAIYFHHLLAFLWEDSICI